MLTAKKVIGDVEINFTSDGKDLKEDLVRISWLTTSPDKCGVCGSPEIMLQGRLTKDKEGEEFIYCEFKCKKCYASATMGEYKNPKGALFVKKWVAYERVEHVK